MGDMVKVTTVFSSLFLLSIFLTGCSSTTDQRTQPKKASTPTAMTQKVTTSKTQTSQETSKILTPSQVIKDIKDNKPGQQLKNIHIIGIENKDGFASAYASYELNGKLKYASIYDWPTQGKGVGVFEAPKSKKEPIQYVETIGVKGYCLITGVVNNDFGIKNVVITFSKGQVKQAPVVNDTFWFFGKIGNSEKQARSKQVIGVSANGSIIKNQT